MDIKFNELQVIPSVLEVYVNNSLYRKVRKSLYIKYLNKIPSFSSEEDLDRFFAKLDQKLAKKVAFSLLSKKPYTVKMLTKALEKRLFPEMIIQQTIQTCISLGFLDDQEHLQRYIKALLEKGYGRKWIQHKVYEKFGEKKMQSLNIDPNQEKQALLEYLKKKPLQSSTPQKLLAKLLRRGFAYDLILEVCATQYSLYF